MKLLVLIHRLPCPPDRGAKLRAAAELRWLSQRHDVWCAGFIDPAGPGESKQMIRDSLDELSSCCRSVAAVPLRRWLAGGRAMLNLARGGTATEGYFASRVLRKQVLDWSRDIGFDGVLAFSSGMAPLAIEVPAGRRVLDLVDLDSFKWTASKNGKRWPMRWVYGTEGRRLGIREREWIDRFDASVVCTQREADLLKGEPCRERLHVIETSLSVEATASRKVGTDGASADAALPEEPIVGFLGAMDYQPNVEGVRWFADAIWPQIRRDQPKACWWIVGRSPTRAVQELDDGSHVRVTGTVPEVESYLQRMRVNVAPLQMARGVQTKVLTAMASARPCVVTPCVAEGIGAEAEREIVVADSPRAFAQAVSGLLADRSRAEAIGIAGRRFVERTFRSATDMERLEGLLLEDSLNRGMS